MDGLTQEPINLSLSDYMLLFDLNHFSWVASDMYGLPVIRWPVSSVEALPGGTSSSSISIDHNGRGSIFHPTLFFFFVDINTNTYGEQKYII